MRDPSRIKSICRLLEKAWGYFPEERMGQFLLNTVFGSLGRDSHIFHKEDNEVETILKLIVEKLDAFKELPEAKERDERESFLKNIFKQNQKEIEKIKRIHKQNQKYMNEFKNDLNI